MKPTLVSNSSTVSLCLGEDQVLTIPRMKPIQKLILTRLLEGNDMRQAYRYAESFLSKAESNYIGAASLARLNMTDMSRDKLKAKRPGHVFRMLVEKYDCLKKKTPGIDSLGEWIGVEIECFIPGSDRFHELNDEVMELRIPGVEMHHDGSIHPDDYDEDLEEPSEGSDYTPVEFTIVYNRNNPEPLKRLCDFLLDQGAQVNKSCGLHVHLDQRDVMDSGPRKATTRAKRLNAALPVLSAMVSETRRNNSYCQSGMSRRSGDRYYAINLTSLAKHNTIEVRLHSGTTDYAKISNWVNLLYTVSRQPGLSKQTIEFYSDLSEALPTVSKELMDYVKSRILKFNPRAQLFRDRPLTQGPVDVEAVETETEDLISQLNEIVDSNYVTRMTGLPNWYSSVSSYGIYTMRRGAA